VSGLVQGAAETAGILRLTTNYEYRGYTRSDDHPSVQLNLDRAWSNGLFLGTWLSSVDLGEANLEANPYIGGQFSLSEDWQLELSAAGYFYDGKLAGEDADYGEGTIQLAYRDLARLTWSVAPDYYGSGHTVVNYELELRHPLTDRLEVSAGLGYQSARQALSYDNLYGNLGVSWFVLPRLTLDLRYHASHELNARQHEPYAAGSLPDYELGVPVVFSLSFGL